MKKEVFFLMFMFLLIPIVAQAISMPVLAVGKNGTDEEGQIAVLHLTSTPGPGYVYVSTYPLSKYDTQLSASIAKEIACRFLKDPCHREFIYRLETESSIVGGPSAGAAMTVLTVGEIKGLQPKQNVAITGTINSGGFIGPVGGVKEKVEAGIQQGLKTILIPRGKRYAEKDVDEVLASVQNESMSVLTIDQAKRLDLYKYGEDRGVVVREVSTISDALPYFYDYDFSVETKNISIDVSYVNTMKSVSDLMCDKTQAYIKQLNNGTIPDEDKRIFEQVMNLSNRANQSLQSGQPYAAASYCFGANIQAKTLIYNNVSSVVLKEKIDMMLNKTVPVEKNFRSLQNMQTWVIVKERYDDSQKYAKEAAELYLKWRQNKTTYAKVTYALSYSEERYDSSKSWSLFYQNSTGQGLNESDMKMSCFNKMQEALGRYNYAGVYFPEFLDGISVMLEETQQHYQNGEYVQCLFQAALAEAKVDVILSVIGMTNEEVPQLVEEKLTYVEQQIAQLPYFPLLGYSYYEYGKSLLEKGDSMSALLYAEYSLELTNIDLYLRGSQDTNKVMIAVNQERLVPILFFASGLLVGIAIGLVHRKKLK